MFVWQCCSESQQSHNFNLSCNHLFSFFNTMNLVTAIISLESSSPSSAWACCVCWANSYGCPGNAGRSRNVVTIVIDGIRRAAAELQAGTQFGGKSNAETNHASWRSVWSVRRSLIKVAGSNDCEKQEKTKETDLRLTRFDFTALRHVQCYWTKGAFSSLNWTQCIAALRALLKATN